MQTDALPAICADCLSPLSLIHSAMLRPLLYRQVGQLRITVIGIPPRRQDPTAGAASYAARGTYHFSIRTHVNPGGSGGNCSPCRMATTCSMGDPSVLYAR